jgi:creatine kinase
MTDFSGSFDDITLIMTDVNDLFIDVTWTMTDFSLSFVCAGALNPQSSVGIYASDPEAYVTFAPVLDAVIKDYHKVSSINHPTPDFGEDKVNWPDLDPSGKYIVSTRVRVGRSHDSYGFPPVLSKEVGALLSLLFLTIVL